jgi:predicted transcriptional regulator
VFEYLKLRDGILMRRNEYDIIAEILELACEGVKKTHLLCAVNLNCKILERYLERLQSLGVIESKEKGKTKFYFTTSLGRKFLEAYHIIKNFSCRKDSSLVQKIKNI